MLRVGDRDLKNAAVFVPHSVDYQYLISSFQKVSNCWYPQKDLQSGRDSPSQRIAGMPRAISLKVRT